MSAPVILAFCAAGPVSHIEAACPSSAFLIYPPVDPAKIAGRALILLAVGPDGGAALARWIDAHGLDAVRGVGLVGVTAPIIVPNCCKFHATGGHPADRHGLIDEAARVYGSATERYTNLGPLEPLRGVAERARVGEPCSCADELRAPGSIDENPHATHPHHYPLRFIVACAPDDGVCPSPGCGGRGWHYGPGFSRPQCDRCAGSGKALSSAEVACELLGRRIPDSQSSDGDGAMEVFVWHPDDARRLVEFALPFVAERLTR